ncbi:T6SS effector BTH_I2691 family protein [Denitromonas halophila]|uniref:Toxin VasX N-terminal region domain-containing protein n=1 Tax=Denitromonas halophila TaxID=1629404 RepID=A0A557R0Y6_9RHOO|nr:T6SS effector BTH_I2691 family protein [Denitromonas halophila]TVO58818.1 hypothetical protein FHP91_03905 [Denitromonas halophila]
MSKNPTCEVCAKSGLSIALFRPSPVAKEIAVAPVVADMLRDAATLVSGLHPGISPTTARPVLRLLRKGYLHVYFEKPLSAGRHWQIYHVTDQAELIPLEMADMINTAGEVVCQRQGHSQATLRSLHIPQAHKTGKVWLAFSANLWSDAIKQQNKADPAVMQCIDVPAILGGERPANSFDADAPSLNAYVAECAIPRFKTARGGALSRFPFVALTDAAGNGPSAQVSDWASALNNIAAAHPKTSGKQFGLVLADPVGFAIELNDLRLRRYSLALTELEKPDNIHALNSSNALMGLKSVMLDGNLARGWDTVAQVMSGGQFKDIMRVRPNPRGWPEGTRWEPLPDTRENRLKYGHGQGRVVFPDHEERAEAWARRQTEATWSRMSKYYDEEKRAAWIDTFDKRLETTHFKPLEAYELDWLGARQSPAFKRVFERHYDPSDPNNPRMAHRPGLIYAAEVDAALTPQPYTRGKALTQWVAELQKEAANPDALLLRALVGNQAEIIAASDQVYALKDGAAIGEHLHENRNDKLLDLGKGVVQQAAEGKMGATAAALTKRFGWLGDALGGYATSIAMSVTGAAAALIDPKTASAIAAGASGLAHLPMDSAAGKALLRKVQSIHMVRQTLDMALQGVVQGGGLRTPVLIHRSMPIDEAMDLLRGRADADMGVSRNQLKRLKRGGQKNITMSVLTDTKTLAEMGGDTKALIEHGNGEIKLGGASRAQQAGAAAATVVLSEEKFIELYQAQSRAVARASAGIGEAFSGAKAAMRSLDGRLALGVIIINAAGVMSNLNNLENAKDAIEVRNAWYGMADASAGVTGGLLELSGVVTKAAMEARSRAPIVVAESTPLTTLAGLAYFLGAIAGVVNGVSAWAKAGDAEGRGDAEVASMYRASFVSFVGMGGAYTLLSAGVVADRMVARGAGGAAVRAIAMRFGAEGTAALFGISVSGWGLILLGAGLIFEVGAILMTPTPLQNWIRRTYFGTGGGDGDPFAKGDWPAEYSALMETLNVATEADTKVQDGSAATPSLDPALENSINIAP